MRFINQLAIASLMVLAGVASAQAQLSVVGADLSVTNVPADLNKSETGIYVVQMEGDPVVAYEGDVQGYAATKPGKGKKINPNSAHVKKYAAFLDAQQNQAMESVGADKVYNYRYAFNGFAAHMSAADAAALQARGDVLHVWKDEIRRIQTDGSPNYIGLTESGEAWSKGRTGENVIIGIIDTGIWPEHPSFADVKTPTKGNKGALKSYDPAPAGFTGDACVFGNMDANPDDAPFECNNKLLAARCYNSGFSFGPDGSNPCGGDGFFTHPNEFQSARDFDGHGSHVAGTAGGNFGVEAVIGGDFQGQVSGIAPRARLVAYKVCWDGPDPGSSLDDGCASSDSAAAIDEAVADGVDVINFSIGGSSTSFTAPDDIAFLFAAVADVFVATSNGNAGPGAQTVGSPAGEPWITAVGATQDDGVFNLAVTVNAPGSIAGDYLAIEGSSPVQLSDTGPITADVTLASDPLACGPVDPISGIALVSRGICAFTTKYNNVAAAGASAIIVFNDGADDTRIDPIIMSAPGTTIPGVMISYYDGLALAGETGVNATMDGDNLISAANRIATFSSRGPNGGAPDIIKPDISAPGVRILAAASPYNSGEMFRSIGGTSMASPHAAGAFALLKQEHPGWTAAEARSALMTTARQGLLKTFGSDPATPFDIGAGEILPTDANDPGLAYHAGLFEYAAFTCGANMGIFTPGSCDFLEAIGIPFDASDLNLPSIGIAGLVGTQTVTRTVTAVYNNEGNKTFYASVDAPPGIDVSVSPSSIVLLGKDDTADYEVTFTVTGDTVMNEWAFGSLTWVHEDDNYYVRSPIAVFPTEASNPGLFFKAVDLTTASPGDTLTYEINVTNGPLTGPITVTDMVPDGTTFVPASETEVVTNGSTTTPWSYDGGSNSLTWEGELDAGSIAVSASPAPFGYVPLSAFFLPFALPGNCDDGAWILSGFPPFTFNGASYGEVIWSINGTIEAGSASGLATSWFNQNLPDPVSPNNLIAPFWRDLNLCAGGNWYAGVLSSGPATWTIFEWEDAPHWEDNTQAATFQIWLGADGTPVEGDIHFTYARMDNPDSYGTVGAENADGDVGDSYFYDGAGTAPAIGVDLVVESVVGGTATLGFQVVTDCSVNPVNIANMSNDAGDEAAVAITTCP